MPYPWRWRRRWQQRRQRRRRRLLRWRPGTLVRRRWRRRQWVRRKFSKKYRKKKLLKLRLNQWQPTAIRKCTITGPLPLLLCGRGRLCNNFTLFAESIVPIEEPGGGAWSYIQITLSALYDEYLKYRNWWTTSNGGLPLVRYLKTTLTFYRSEDTDYIVKIIRCPPFSVTREDYLDTQPSRMLLDKRTILIPSSKNKKYKKNYIKKTIYPPSLWSNKWYFQQDICNFPFFILKTAACSLQQFFQPVDQLSNNITLWTLNTDFFQNPNWKPSEKTGYLPKQTRDGPIYLYGTHNGAPPDDTNITYKHLVYLGETQLYKEGSPITDNQLNDNLPPKEQWGNPFHHSYQDPDARLFYSTSKPTSNTSKKPSRLYYMWEPCRYNPLKDTGKGNKMYYKSTSIAQHPFHVLPENNKIILEGYPLWLMAWAFTSWIKKSKPIQHLDDDYQIVIQSDFITPKRSAYLFLDNYFRHPPSTLASLTETERNHWHPAYRMQTEMENSLGETGPGAPKINYTKSIHAEMKYKVHVKWGGCPAPMEQIFNPCEQEKYPTPGAINSRYEIQSPSTPKEYYLYQWDEKRGCITEPAAKRLKSQISEPCFTDSGHLNPRHKTQETDESSSEEETQAQTVSDKLQLLQSQLKQLRHRLKRLT
nr:MAG: ORF1 [TTV-like mini virus]